MQGQGGVQVLACRIRTGVHHLSRRQFAVIVGDFLLSGVLGHFLADSNRLLPILFLLIDFQEITFCLLITGGSPQPNEDFLRTVQQACLEKILAQLGKGLQLQFGCQICPINQTLVHADGALGFPPPPKKITQGKMQLNGLGIHLHHFDEGFYRLIGLLIEKEVEPLKIGTGQRPGFLYQVFDINARRCPAKDKKQREKQ